MGEFGTLGELTGHAPLRGHPSGARLEPPLVSPGLQPVGLPRQAHRSGYLFRLHLPARDGRWVRVDEDPAKRDVDAAERRWCVFAWPPHRDERTRRTFRIDQTGRVTATEAEVDPSRFARVDTADWIEVR